MRVSRLFDPLIRSLRRLPGVGPKSAQRMAFHLLERDREGAVALARALQQAASDIAHCADCNTLTEAERCALCTDARRDRSLLCVVGSPADVLALEQARSEERRVGKEGRAERPADRVAQ